MGGAVVWDLDLLGNSVAASNRGIARALAGVIDALA